MKRRDLLSRPLTWMALLALLWGVLAPSLAQLAPPASQTVRLLVEFCTHAGTDTLEIEVPSSSQLAHSDMQQTQHCPFCRHANADVAILHPGIDLAAPSGVWFVYPPRFYNVAARLHAWTAALARAPPQLA